MKGSIQKRTGKRGVSWYVVLDLPSDPLTGKRRQKRLSAPTRKELEAKVAETLHKVNTGTYIEASTQPLADFLTAWLERIESTVRPATHDRYRRIVERQIGPALGSIQLGKLTPGHVQDFYSDRLKAGLSQTTVALYHGVLHRALEDAVKRQEALRNVCDAVTAPRPNSPEMTTWTAAEVRTFLQASADDDLAALWRLALMTGMRRGELLALRWQDVNLDAGMLSVRRTVSRGKDGIVFGEPKTAKGKRRIELDSGCVEALRAHRKEQLKRRLMFGPAWEDTDLVFERGTGEVLHPNVLGSRFQTLVKAVGLPRIRLHDLRHTAATLMLENGAHPKIVQERLGHSDISMTLNRYSHVMPGMQRDVADRLAAAIGA